MSRCTASNTPSSSKAGQVIGTATPSRSAKGKIIVVNDSTPTRPAKRARTTTPRTAVRRGAGSVTPRRSHTRQRASRGSGRSVTSLRNDVEASDDDEASDASSSADDLVSTLVKSANTSPSKSFVHRNAFDAYFATASRLSRTSNNVFSELLSPLTPDEYTTALANLTTKNAAELEQVLKGHENLFPRYALELAEGFNVLFFGFGSKRTVLNNFARTVCAKRGHVVLVNGYMPRLGIKEVIASIEEVPGLLDIPLPSSTPGLEGQTRRIYEFFLPPAVRPENPSSIRPLFLIVHNIDSPALRTPKAKAALSLLALNPRIHLVASIDHINAQMIWSTAEASTRKHSYGKERVGADFSVPPTRGFAWVWHDMTTMQHYDAELAHVNLNSIGKRSGKAVTMDKVMSESAAQHILASVNVKAKKLFALLATTLLTSLEESSDGNKIKEKQPQIQLQHHAVSYEALFNAARTDFIATNDTSFKALLSEFRDHKLVVATINNGGEALWIPLRGEELRNLVSSIAAEQ